MGIGGTCCDVAGDGKAVVVGHVTGCVTIWDAGLLECRAQVDGGGGEAVAAVRFCPASRHVAVAWGGRGVGVLAVGGGEVRRCGPDGRVHSSRVLQVDWARDGRMLRTCDATGDVLYWTFGAAGRAELAAATEGRWGTRDAEWASETCRAGWDRRALWPPGTPLGSVAAVAVTHGGGTIAAGGDDGAIRLGRFPAVDPRAGWQEVASGHGAGVCGLEFSGDDGVLWSLGGGDVAFHQWRHVPLTHHDSDAGPGPLHMRAD
jgi:WD40 repeat protein